MWKIRLSSWRRGNAFTMVSLAQWLHHGAISRCENLFFLQKRMPIRGMQNHDIHANGVWKLVCPWVILIFFRKTVARQSFLTTHQIVNSRQADKQTSSVRHTLKSMKCLQNILTWSMRWQPQSMDYKVDVALLLLTVEVLSAFVFRK